MKLFGKIPDTQQNTFNLCNFMEGFYLKKYEIPKTAHDSQKFVSIKKMT